MTKHRVSIELMGTNNTDGSKPYVLETHYFPTETQSNRYADKREKDGASIYLVDQGFDQGDWFVIIDRDVIPGEFDAAKLIWTEQDS